MIEVAYSVGALVRAVQMLAVGLDRMTEVVDGGSGGDRTMALAEARAALVEAKRTADTSTASAVKLLEAMGETRP